MGITCSELTMQIESEERFIADMEAEMEATLERIPYSARLLSIKGPGIVSVAGLIGEVGDFFGTTPTMWDNTRLPKGDCSKRRPKG
jgi:hypothetical protein